MHGVLHKMRVEAADVVRYYLRLGNDEVLMNDAVGHRMTLHFTGTVRCTACDSVTPKSYSQGYCYNCFTTLPQTDLCMMSPDRCHFDAGTCRDPEFGESVCMRPHVVYIANSSGIKVGITREQNIPGRWIDQGAVQAVPVFATRTRKQAGFVEVAIGNHVSDRTQWQRMLMADDPLVDLETIAADLITQATPDIEAVRNRFGASAIERLPLPRVQQFRYPVDAYPARVIALKPEVTPEIDAVLYGIKGQYLVFDKGVINLRKYTGHEVTLTISTEKPGAATQLSLL